MTAFALASSQASAPLAPRGETVVHALEQAAAAVASRGFVHVRGQSAALESLARHLDRVARAAGRASIRVSGLPTDDAWREAVARATSSPVDDPLAAAQIIAERCDGALVVVVDHARTQWGRTAADELARILAQGDAGPTVIVLASNGEPPRDARALELGACTASELRSVYRALAAEAQVPDGIDAIDGLEAWWIASQRTPVLDGYADAPALSPTGRRLLGRLWLSQRAWSLAQASALGSAAARDELVAKGVFAVDPAGRLLATGAPMPALETDSRDAIDVARALEVTWPGDHWAAARASELFAIGGEHDLAEQAAGRAINALTDASARADFWSRWEATLASLPAADATPRLRRAAELAIKVGDVDRALAFSRALAARDDSFDAMLTLGRATTVRGDLTTAAIVLEKALAKSVDASSRARASVEMAEVRYMMGQLDDARAHAESGLAQAADTGTQLSARNVLGKLLLARGEWAEAERHFASDACDAACGGDLTGELRARLNRAIALLSSGRRDEARGMLQAVLEEGERAGEPRAVSFALQNLAAIAILRHEYTDALRLTEQAINVCRRVGEKIALARVIANLAELRLRLGLVAEAEQALAFGRKVCGPGIPAGRAAHFSIVAARAHLARGNTLEASAEIAAALAAASSSSDGGKACECHRLAARVALDDGDLPRAAIALEKARGAAGSTAARAEIALLDAQRARAAGEAYLDLALDALDLSREGDDAEITRDAHLIVHFARAEAGDLQTARAHLDAALALRARVADALPQELRARFLGRRDLAPVARLAELRDDDHVIAVAPVANDARAPRTAPPTLRASGAPRGGHRGIVGQDPAIVALRAAIQKVGPSDATVLVHGESGTGKELVAEGLHEASNRRAGPLVKVNCAALVETLLLSELFGHEKGAFTGAAARRRGRFEAAEGGTLFLDEIGDISPRTQVALLRVLQEKTFERVGGVTPIRANVRIVCATHRDLKAMVARGEFREDLYYRLRGVVIEVPALRARTGDLGAIAEVILGRVAAERGVPTKRLSTHALAALARHAWPGNVRELENALRAAALFAENEALEVEDFTNNVDGLRDLGVSGPASEPLPATSPAGAAAVGIKPASDLGREPRESAPPSTDEHRGASPTDIAYAHVRSGVSLSDMKRLIEKDCIERALAEAGGNITRAATLLGMKRPRLSQLVKQYGFGGVDADASDGLDTEEM